MIKNHLHKYVLHSFRGGEKTRSLICNKNKKIVVPKVLQERIVQWYHTYLSHPGINRTEMTIRQHFNWKNLDKTVLDVCTKCPTCQTTKRSTRKYGHLPPKETEAKPWEIVCVDMIGPYTMRRVDGKNILTLWALTIIDPATGWFELNTINEKSAIEIANLLEIVWLSRHPWPI